MKGAIICGYPGIGKSTLSSASNGFIDLESGNYWVNGKRDEYWYVVCCNTAIHLAKQGYKVFMSCHETIRKHLESLPNDPDVTKLICFPAPELESLWVNKLLKRFMHSCLDKDFKAWQNSAANYAENISELLEQEGFQKIILTDMKYDLESIICEFLKENEKC